MSVVYVVDAHVEYEGSTPIKAFVNKADGLLFIAECAKYKLTEPACPSLLGESADAEWEAFYPPSQSLGEGASGGRSECQMRVLRLRSPLIKGS